KRHVAGFTRCQRQHGLTVADNLPRRSVHGGDDARLRRDQARPAEAFAGISPRGLAAFYARAGDKPVRTGAVELRAGYRARWHELLHSTDVKRGDLRRGFSTFIVGRRAVELVLPGRVVK